VFTVDGQGFHTVVEAIAADFSRFLYVVDFHTGGDIFAPSAPAVDRAGAVYVTGIATAGSFPTTPGVFQSTATRGEPAGVVAKIAPDSSLAYATLFGNASTVPTAVAVDASGNAYITGHAGPGLPTVNARQPALAGGASDAFIARLNATATGLVFSTYLGGGGDDAALAIALDGAANIYVAGPTTSVDFPQQNALPPQLGQAGSNFVVGMTPDGRALVYSTYFADAQTTVTALHATPTGTAYLSGKTTSAAFPTVRPEQATYGGSGDAFIATHVGIATRDLIVLNGAAPGVVVTSPPPGAIVGGVVWSGRLGRGSSGGHPHVHAVDRRHHTRRGERHRQPRHASLGLIPRARRSPGSRRDGARRDRPRGTATRAVMVVNGAGPGVFITSPAAGANVSGLVWSDVWVEGAAAGTRTFTLSIGGTTLATASDSGNHVTLLWIHRACPTAPGDRRDRQRQRWSHRGGHAHREHPERCSGGAWDRATAGSRVHAVRLAAREHARPAIRLRRKRSARPSTG
jgi:hypothetical protein